MRILVALAMAGALAACGGGAPGESGNVATTIDTAPATAAANQVPTVGCADLPEWVKLPTDARVTTCTSGEGPQPGHQGGTVIYATAAAPAEVLAHAKEAASRAGLGQRLSSDVIYSAGEGSNSVMVLTEAEASGTRVTVNWGRQAG